MAKQYASLECIINDHKITPETDCEFLHHLQSGLLLALKEQGKLSKVQYHHAQDRLDQQYRKCVKKSLQKGHGG